MNATHLSPDRQAATASISAPVMASEQLLRAALLVEPELGKLYALPELEVRLKAQLWRLKLGRKLNR